MGKPVTHHQGIRESMVVTVHICLAFWLIGAVQSDLFGQQPASDPPREVSAEIPNWEDVPGNRSFIADDLARERFRVNGEELAVVLVSSGINPKHRDFDGRLLPGRSFAGDEETEDTTDRLGVGSHEAGIIAHIAPAAKLIPVKVVGEQGTTRFGTIARALEWILEDRKGIRDQHGVLPSAVCLTVSTGESLQSLEPDELEPDRHRIWKAIARLREQNVAVCVPAGNRYQEFDRELGMGFPAICHETISVGAVYGLDLYPGQNEEPAIKLPQGGARKQVLANEIAYFSQRLRSPESPFVTDTFTPGFAVLSAGPFRDDDLKRTMSARTIQSGTSSACAAATGAMLLLQDRCRKLTSGFGSPDWLPSVDLLETAIREGGLPASDEDRNEAGFTRLHVIRSISVIDRHYRNDLHRIRHSLLMQAQENPDKPVLDVPKGVQIIEKDL